MIKQKNNEKAFFSLRFIIYTGIFALFMYCSFWVGRFYFDYYAVKDAARNIFLEAHTKSDARILDELKVKIRHLGTPIFDGDIKINRKPGSVNLKIEYSEYLFIGDISLHKFNFVIDETRYFKK